MISKKNAFRLLSLLCGSFGAFVICEFTLRIVGIGYGHAPLESDPVLHHVHPVNYEFISHTPSGEYGGHVVYYDEFGCRASRDHQPGDCRYRVAFMGDSFTEATQVSVEDSFAGQIRRLCPNACVRNYGVSSYCPILHLIQWRDRVKSFKPTHVVVQLFNNDIADDTRYSKIAVYGDNGDLQAVPGPRGGWFTKQARKSYFARFLRKHYLRLNWSASHNETKNVVGNIVEEDPNLSELSKSILLQLVKEVEASGAKFVLTVVPSKYRIFNKIFNDPTPQFSDKWKHWAIENDIRFADLVEPFERAAKDGNRLFFDRDIHFSSAGHRIVADAILFELDSFDSHDPE